jgi:hypothetical protein
MCHTKAWLASIQGAGEEAVRRLREDEARVRAESAAAVPVIEKALGIKRERDPSKLLGFRVKDHDLYVHRARNSLNQPILETRSEKGPILRESEAHRLLANWIDTGSIGHLARVWRK